MAWNLNNYDNEYELTNSQTEETIDIFGLQIKYVKAKGQNLDEIFGEYTHKKLNQDSTLLINVLPENSEEFDMLGNTFSKFGFVHTETFNCYISSNTSDNIGYEDIRSQAVGDIIVLPNGKKFEITFVEHEVPGANNMFPYSNKKNVYMIKSKLWNYSGDVKEEATEELDENNEVIETDNLGEFNFTKLDDIFNNTDKTNEDETPKDNNRVETQNKKAKDLDVDSKDIFWRLGIIFTHQNIFFLK
jgi:hypothetical protein